MLDLQEKLRATTQSKDMWKGQAAKWTQVQ